MFSEVSTKMHLLSDQDARFNRFDMDYCCENKTLCSQDQACTAKCEKYLFEGEKFLGADAGYFYKWQIEDGVPTGCKGFKVKTFYSRNIKYCP